MPDYPNVKLGTWRTNSDGWFYAEYDPPKPSGWRVWYLPGCFYQPLEGEVPNRFHRFMQRVCFGFKWERVK